MGQVNRPLLAAACFLLPCVTRPVLAQEARWRDLSISTMQLYAEGKYREALPIVEEALKVAEATFGPDHTATAGSLNNLGELYRILGRDKEAGPLLRRALSIWEKAAPPEPGHVAAALNNLGLLADERRDFTEAENDFRRALDLWSKILPPKDSRLVRVRNGLGFVLFERGAYGEAEQVFLEALSLATAAPDGAMDEARVRGNLGALYSATGRLDQAEDSLARSFSLWKVSPAPDHPDVIFVLMNLGDLFCREMKYKEAETVFLQALRLRAQLVGAANPRLAPILTDLGAVFEAEGDFERARPALERAIDIYEAAFGRDPPQAATAVMNLGALYFHRDYAKAFEYLDRARRIDARNPGTGPAHDNAAETNLAMLYYSQGKYRDALPLLDDDLHALRSQFDEEFAYSTEQDRLQLLASLGYRIDFYLSFCYRYRAELPQMAASMYDAVLWEKGLIAESMTGVYAQARAGDSETRSLLSRISAIRTQLASLRDPPSADLDRWTAEVNRLEAQKTEIERTLVRSLPALAEQTNSSRATWRDVQRSLKPDEAAVEFVRFPYHDGKHWDNDGYYAALILTSDSGDGPALISLGEARSLEKAPFVDYENLVAEVPTEGAGGLFYRSFWKPLEAQLKGRHRLYISADGALSKVSFAVLPDEAGKPLIERYDIRNLFSTRDLLRLQNPFTEKSAVLIGNPRFATPAPANSVPSIPPAQPPRADSLPKTALNRNCPDLPPGGVLCPLKDTQRELETILPLLRKADWKVEALTGESARKSSVQGVMHPRVLHIATHGYFAPDRQPQLRDFQAGAPAGMQDPMRRSGLLFAGADAALNGQPPASDGDDGVLSAYEAVGIDLHGTELVVLSACDTGQGEVKNDGEGVFGLRRAFREAGAESVMMSMWKAPDRETRNLMTLFYANWLSGEDKAEALLDAQKTLRAQVMKRWGGEDRPYYWGGFVLSGR